MSPQASPITQSKGHFSHYRQLHENGAGLGCQGTQSSVFWNLALSKSKQHLTPKKLDPDSYPVSQFSETRIKAIKTEIAERKGDGEQGFSIFHQLLRSNLPESEKATARLNSEAFVLLAAGTISTATTLSLITYYVLENTEIHRRLLQELSEVMKDYPVTSPSWAELEKLPFLTGCVKEGLRSVDAMSFFYTPWN